MIREANIVFNDIEDKEFIARFEERKANRKRAKMIKEIILVIVIIAIITALMMVAAYNQRGYFAIGSEVFAPAAAIGLFEFLMHF